MRCSSCRDQFRDTDKVVGGDRQREGSSGAIHAAEPCLALSGNGLDPAVSGMARGAAVESGMLQLRRDVLSQRLQTPRICRCGPNVMFQIRSRRCGGGSKKGSFKHC